MILRCSFIRYKGHSYFHPYILSLSVLIYLKFLFSQQLPAQAVSTRETKHTGYHKTMDSHDETGCQAPILCINNCGFFGRAATMNMCSKCYKDMLLKQEQDKHAAESVENIVNGGSGCNRQDVMTGGSVDVQVGNVEAKTVSAETCGDSWSGENLEMKTKTCPNRCATCRKRIGLTGFNCKCGNLFCAIHRHSDKHDCPFDYQTVGRDAIAKANPIIKADKLDKM